MKTYLLAALTLITTVAQAEQAQQIATNASYSAPRTHGTAVFAAAAGTAGKTVVVWGGPQMDVYARAYNHASNAWENSVLIRNNSYTFADAYHNYPVISIAPNGKLLVMHFNHNQEGYLFTPAAADTIDTTWTRSTFLPASEEAAYPTPVVAGNTIYVFYRSKVSDTYRKLRFVKSSDNGVTWTTPKTIIDTEQGQSDNLNTVYPDDVGYEAASSGRSARLRISWHLAGGAFNNEKKKNIYFAYINPVDDTAHTVSGVSLGSSINASDFAAEASNSLRVVLAEPAGSVLMAVTDKNTVRPVFNQSARPLVGYNADFGQGQAAYSAYWTGSTWVRRRMVQGSTNIAGKLLDYQYVDSSRIRALMRDGTTIFAKETSDQGATWTSTWSLNVASNLINGADSIGYVNAISKPGMEVQAIAGTFNDATRKTDYSGKWGIFVIKD